MSRYEDLRSNLSARPFRWVVTGAAGFIGSHLVENLISLNQHVTGIDCFLSGKQKNLDEALANAGNQSSFRLIKGDIRDMEICREACEEADFVLHQAALVSVPRSFEEPHLNNSCNVTGFLNMLISARDANVRSFVFASSAAVYGDQPEGPIREDAPLAPMSPYAVAKRAGELYSQVLSGGIRTAGLRYMNAYGPRQDPSSPYSGVISIWTEQLRKGQPLVIYGDGKTTRDFVFVDDIVQANILAAMADQKTLEGGNIFNIGTGVPTDLDRLLSLIVEAARNVRPGIADVTPRYMPARVGDIMHSRADITLARKTLGYEPLYTLAQGLEKTIIEA
ncbi:MAG: NAD-dependent epimerase/dehydratase family protein [Thermovirgaceae bacterium]|nr:NAD-dependent epimerase/dehydratase family protein [Thermovirgaceae bacterium]